jgi:iron-sulfur cluster assembly accessory protein
MDVTRVQPHDESHSPVSLTPKAIEMVKEEMAKAHLNEGWALRISVVGGGCSGFQYDMDFSNERKEGDVLSEQGGLPVVIDERSALYLSGTTVDYVDTFGSQGFKFSNPNAKKTCGCGSSFTAES